MPQYPKGTLAITFALVACSGAPELYAEQTALKYSPSGVPLDESTIPSTAQFPPPINSINSTPSFYGASARSGSSALGIPGFVGQQGAAESFLENPLHWGPIIAHPHLGYGYTYATGVLVNPGELTTTALHTVSPGLGLESRHVNVDYTPSLNYYSKGPYDDVVNHSASLTARVGYGDWLFTLGQTYLNYTDPLIETGTQTASKSFNTLLGASWRFNEKIFFDFGLTQQIQDTEGFQNFREWSTMNWVNYRLTDHLSVGGGLGAGYTDADSGSDMTDQQVQGRLNWFPSSRISLSVNGGIEIRQFLDAEDSGSMVNPLMGVSLQYHPFEFTTLFVSANHSVDTSIFSDEVSVTTAISGGISQRLLKHLSLGFTGGYRNSDYVSISDFSDNTFPTARQDEFSFVSVSLGTAFLKRGTASVAYQRSKNKSTSDGFTYDSDQLSFQVAYRY